MPCDSSRGKWKIPRKQLRAGYEQQLSAADARLSAVEALLCEATWLLRMSRETDVGSPGLREWFIAHQAKDLQRLAREWRSATVSADTTGWLLALEPQEQEIVAAHPEVFHE